MVSNRSLAQIAEQYGLPAMFIANASSKYMIQAAQKSKGSLFEAYVAGVYYSFLMPREEAESEGSGDTIRPAEHSGNASPQTLSEVENGEVGVNMVDKVDSNSSSSGESPAEDSTSPVPVPSPIDRMDLGSVEDVIKPSPIVAESKQEDNSTKPTGIDDLFSFGLKSKPPIKSDVDTDKAELSTPPPTSQSPDRSNTPLSRTPTQVHRTHGQAFDHLCSWLWPLFTPVAVFLSTYLETESSLSLADNCPPPNPNQAQRVPNEWKMEDTKAAGAIGALNQYLGKTYGCGYLPTWITKKRVMDVWRMVCIVRTPEGKEW